MNRDIIKAQSCLFEIRYTINGKVYKKTGIDTIIPELNIPVLIGVDQSTKQTGICITTLSGKILLVLDIINYGLDSSELYTAMLDMWVENNFNNLIIEKIIYEEVDHNAPQMYVRRKLQAVADIFNKFKYRYKGSGKMDVCCINNLTWKKHFLADDKYKGRRRKTQDVKLAVQEEVCSRFPELIRYQSYNLNHDSCDAVGIVMGFLDECFIDRDITKLKINTTMKNNPKRKYYKKYVDTATEKLNVNSNCIQAYYNKDLTLEENCLRALNYHPEGMILIPTTMKDIMLWKFDSNKDLSNKSVLIVGHLK